MENKNYKVVRIASGERFIKMDSGVVIPADIAGLAVGKDKWMSEVRCRCRDCNEFFPLSQLHGGGQWCEECQTADIEG